MSAEAMEFSDSDGENLSAATLADVAKNPLEYQGKLVSWEARVVEANISLSGNQNPGPLLWVQVGDEDTLADNYYFYATFPDDKFPGFSEFLEPQLKIGGRIVGFYAFTVNVTKGKKHREVLTIPVLQDATFEPAEQEASK